MTVDLVHALNLTLVAEALKDGRVDALRLNIVSEQLFAAADHIEAIRAKNERLKSALTKAKAFHDRDSGCNGFTADYEILRLEIDEALGAFLSGGQP